MRLGCGSALMATDGHHGVPVHRNLDSGMRSMVDSIPREVHGRKVDAYIGTISKFDEWPRRNMLICQYPNVVMCV